MRKSDTRKLQEVQGMIDEVIESEDSIHENAPLLYEGECLRVYESADHFPDENLMIEYTCRDDLGVVMIGELSRLYWPIRNAIGHYPVDRVADPDGNEWEVTGYDPDTDMLDLGEKSIPLSVVETGGWRANDE